MIDRIIRFALTQPLFLLLILGLFIAGGVAAFKTLPIEAYPDIGDIQATVVTLFPGHASEEVEKQVTTPIEIGLTGIPHSVRIFSHTQFGLSYVVVTFDDQIDDYFARQQVLERLQNISGLPTNVQPNLAPLSTAIGEVYRYRLKGDHLNAMDLRTLQDWVVSRQLRQCPGVADIVTLGGFIKRFEVNIDPQKLDAFHASLQNVLGALNRGSANAGGSFIEQGDQQLIVRGVGLLRSADEIGEIVIDARAGSPVLIKDVASVVISAVPRQGAVGQDDTDEVVTGIVLMRKGENPSDVLKDVKERIATINAKGLPKGVQIMPFYDREQLVKTTLHTVFENLIAGALLVGLVLLVFLGSWRAASIVAVVIPLALLATFIGLRMRGISANLLSLGAMDFGIIVDGAVIVMENIFRRLSERPLGTREEKRNAIWEAAVQVGRPTFFSMLIIIIAHVPIFALQRHEGRIFSPMAYTIISALIGSLLMSLTVVPLLSYFFMRSVSHEQENLLVRVFQRIYAPLLAGAIRWRKSVLALALTALVATGLLATHLGTEFLPELNEGTLWLNINMPVSISLTESCHTCARLRKLIGEVPEVRTVISKVGRPEDGTDPKMVNMGEFFVDIKPQGEWRKGYSRQQIYDDIKSKLDVQPGIDLSFSQPIRDNVLESISQIDGQIVVKIFGDDMAQIQAITDNVFKIVEHINGVGSAAIDRAGTVPQLQIKIDRARAARYGINIGDVEDVIEATLGGKTASEIWEGDKRFDIAVCLPAGARNDMNAIRQIPIDTPSGAHIPLDSIADLVVSDGKVNISHENGRRLQAISIFIRGRDMGSLVEEMKEKVEAAVTLPTGYEITYGGEFENQQRAMKRLSQIVPISVFLIFILLFNAFGSVVQALLILANIPLALIGGVVILAITGIPLSVSAAIGFIALMGQAVLNGVVMVSYFNDLRASGLSPMEVVSRGSLVRMRTVLMTASLAMLGLLPMALSHAIGSEVQKPLAVVVIGGLVSATLLTLVVVPILYFMIDRRPRSDVLAGALACDK